MGKVLFICYQKYFSSEKKPSFFLGNMLGQKLKACCFEQLSGGSNEGEAASRQFTESRKNNFLLVPKQFAESVLKH